MTAGYLATSHLHLFHRQVVSSRRAPSLRGITAPGHHQAQVEPVRGHLPVVGADPGPGRGDVVGVSVGECFLQGAVRHVDGVHVQLALDLRLECRLVVAEVVAQAGVVY